MAPLVASPWRCWKLMSHDNFSMISGQDLIFCSLLSFYLRFCLYRSRLFGIFCIICHLENVARWNLSCLCFRVKSISVKYNLILYCFFMKLCLLRTEKCEKMKRNANGTSAVFFTFVLNLFSVFFFKIYFSRLQLSANSERATAKKRCIYFKFF